MGYGPGEWQNGNEVGDGAFKFVLGVYPDNIVDACMAQEIIDMPMHLFVLSQVPFYSFFYVCQCGANIDIESLGELYST